MAVVFIVLVALSLIVMAQSGLINFLTGIKAKKALVSATATEQLEEKVVTIEASKLPENSELKTAVSAPEAKKQEEIKPAVKPAAAVTYRITGEPVKKFTAVINGKSFTAEVEEVEAVTKEEPVSIQKAPVTEVKPVQPRPVVNKPEPKTPAAVPTAESNTNKSVIISAPVPGTVLEIRTTVGAKVKRGDILMLLEAMKMENEIMAAKDGTIVQIMTNKGATVTMGMPLIEMQ
jgi:glutaconyl-CoA decarboxylase